MSIQPTCKSCKFYYRPPPGTPMRSMGQCRRNSPRASGGYPASGEVDWCGDHKERTFGPGWAGTGFDDSVLYNFLDDVAAAFGFVRKEKPRDSDRPCADCSGAGRFADGVTCDACGGTGKAVVF